LWATGTRGNEHDVGREASERSLTSPDATSICRKHMTQTIETTRTATRVAKARPRRQGWGRYGVALLALLLASAVGIVVGKAPVDPGTLLAILLSKAPFSQVTPWWPASFETILLEVRLPRVIMGALVGAGLSVAGASYQGLFRNPLADPYLVGVASGAGLGAAMAMVAPLPPALYTLGAVQLAAFLGGLLTVGLVYFMARVGRTTPVTTLLLAGVAVGSLANAATSFVMYAQGDKITVIYAWMLGGFNVTGWQQVLLVSPYIAVAIVGLTLLGGLSNLLLLDEDQARSLGVNVELTKIALVLLATLSTAAAVSAAGLIGFVGLVVPHVVRMLWGPDHRSLIPLSALVGAAFMVAADTLARGIPGAQEVPAGVVTAFCGAPFFLYLLRRQKRSVF
jgi:iron complex transport system permease protein